MYLKIFIRIKIIKNDALYPNIFGFHYLYSIVVCLNTAIRCIPFFIKFKASLM
jgi:hypothetical protein